jgi:hypothetical protein
VTTASHPISMALTNPFLSAKPFPLFFGTFRTITFSFINNCESESSVEPSLTAITTSTYLRVSSTIFFIVVLSL